MRALLDTHVFLWAALAPERLSAAGAAIFAADAELELSLVSAWEIVVKYQTGRLQLPEPPVAFTRRQMRAQRLLPLPIGWAHLAHLAHLATVPRLHRDPFDRMLIAQALAEGMPLVSADPALAQYGVPIIW